MPKRIERALAVRSATFAPLDLPADKHPVATLLARVGSKTRKNYRINLRTIVRHVMPSMEMETFPWTTLEPQHVAFMRQALVDARYSPVSVNTMMNAIRGVVKESWRLGYITADHMARCLDFKPVRGERLAAGRALSEEEIAKLFASCRDDPLPLRGARDSALLVLIYFCGMRREEAALARIEDLRSDEHGHSLRVIGKGNKERWIPIPVDAWAWLDWWLQLRPADLPDGPILVRFWRGQADPAKRSNKKQPTAIHFKDPRKTMHTNGIGTALKIRMKLAGIKGATTHDFRRTYITRLLEKKVDIATVAKLVGHAQLHTTQRYDRRAEITMRDAVEQLTMPDVPAEGEENKNN